jgi:hypothetical protein
MQKKFFSALLACLLVAASLRAADLPPEVVLFDFETPQQALESADRIQCVKEHVTQGTFAGKVVLDKPFAPNIFISANANQGSKWPLYDQYALDVFVEGGPVTVTGFINDKDSQGWWKRYNYDLRLEPGKRKVSFTFGGLKRQSGENTLDIKTISFIAMTFSSEDAAKPATIYLDNGRLEKGTGAFEKKVLYSFEGADQGKYELEDYPEEFKGKSKMVLMPDHATDGAKALQLESHAPAGNIRFFDFDHDWSKYDVLQIDVFSPNGEPLPVNGWVRADDPKAGWFDRFNYERVLRPGMNILRLPVGGMSKGEGGKMLNTANIVGFNLAVPNATIVIDNVRLIRGTEEIPVPGMKKFDFGPANSAVMPGFTQISKSTAYSKGAGFGWQPGGSFGRDFDISEMLGRHRPADDLCRDFCQPVRATFSVDAPNGKYGVWLMLGPPGNGWGGMFTHRTVTANGNVVVDEKYDLESFKKHEYEFQDVEDLPGDDLWEKYINTLFKPTVFDVEVKDGQLNLDFDSHGEWWSAMVDGMVLWPKEQDTNAQRWLENLKQQRKEEYQSLHVEKAPAVQGAYTPTAEETARGYVRFIHTVDKDIQVNAVPAPNEVKTASLKVRAAPGQYEDKCIGVYALKDCGKISISVSDLKGPNGATVPASAVNTQVVRYKDSNFTAVYTSIPKYLDTVPAEGVEAKPGVTRSFWLLFHVPVDAAAGEYKGTATLSFAGGAAAGKKDTVDVSLTVLPIKLAEVDFPMGMFMMAPTIEYAKFDPSGEVRWAAIKEMLVDAKAHGITSVDPMIGMQLKKISNGKAEVNFAEMDRFMELAKAAGFTHELLGYALDLGFGLKMPADYAGTAKNFGVARYEDVVKAYFDAVREHSKEKGWLPICFCTADEYVVHPGGNPELLGAHHKILNENAPGFHFVPVDSMYFTEHPDKAASYEKGLADIDTWGAGIHSPKEAEIQKKNGHRLWLYNTGMNRFTFGTYMFFARKKYDVSGFFQWVYPGTGTYGNFYFASHNEGHYGVTYPSTHGLRSTPTWERIRMGCNDHQYLETAWSLIQSANKAGKGQAEAKELQAQIEHTFGLLKFGKANVDAADGQGKADNPMSPEGMEAFRDTLANGIVKLTNALK